MPYQFTMISCYETVVQTPEEVNLNDKILSARKRIPPGETGPCYALFLPGAIQQNLQSSEEKYHQGSLSQRINTSNPGPGVALATAFPHHLSPFSGILYIYRS